MKRFILLAIVTMVSCVSIAQTEIPTAKRLEIERMLRLTGMEKLMGQMTTQMITSLKVQIPQLSQTFWTKFESKINARDLIDKLIPLYDKYYTLEDLKAVNAFYQSPSGQKMLSTLPQVMQESMKIGQEWGAQIGKQAELEAEQALKTSGRN